MKHFFFILRVEVNEILQTFILGTLLLLLLLLLRVEVNLEEWPYEYTNVWYEHSMPQGTTTLKRLMNK